MDAYVTVGVDIGQKVDPTAIVVCEATRPTPQGVPASLDLMMRSTRTAPKVETIYTARMIQRLPLGTPYPEVAAAIVEVVKGLQLRTVQKPILMVDATGVGLPVVDILRQALAGRPHVLVACLFTHGERYTKDTSNYRAPAASVGKAYLVSRLQALLQTQRIKLPETNESRVLAKELQEYEIRVDEDANMKAGAFRVGSHDDLVTALGLAVLDDPIKEAMQRRAVVHR